MSMINHPMRDLIRIVENAGQENVLEAAEKVEVRGRDLRVLRGCRAQDAVRFMQSTADTKLRGLYAKNEYFLWDAAAATHDAVAQALGLDWWDDVEAIFYLRQDTDEMPPTIIFPRGIPPLDKAMSCLAPLLTGDLIWLQHRRFLGTLSDYRGTVKVAEGAGQEKVPVQFDPDGHLFMTGECHVLALALHRRMGEPMAAVMTNNGDGWKPAHVMIGEADGMEFLDIEGWRSLPEIISDLEIDGDEEDYRVVAVTEAKLKRWCKPGVLAPITDLMWQRAEAAAIEMLTDDE